MLQNTILNKYAILLHFGCILHVYNAIVYTGLCHVNFVVAVI